MDEVPYDVEPRYLLPLEHSKTQDTTETTQARYPAKSEGVFFMPQSTATTSGGSPSSPKTTAREITGLCTGLGETPSSGFITGGLIQFGAGPEHPAILGLATAHEVALTAQHRHLGHQVLHVWILPLTETSFLSLGSCNHMQTFERISR